MKTFPNFDASKSYEGTCQVCHNKQVVKSAQMVLHGYVRPGYGYIEGECPGRHEAPFELSCDVAKRHLKWLVEKSIPNTEKRIADLKADKVDELFVRIATGYEYSGRRSRFGGNAKRTYTCKTIQRGYVHAKEGQYDYDDGRTFDDYRQDALRTAQANLKSMHEDVKTLKMLIKGWKYSPENLVTHEAAKKAEKSRVEANKLAAGFRRDWKELWSGIGASIRNHGDAQKRLDEQRVRSARTDAEYKADFDEANARFGMMRAFNLAEDKGHDARNLARLESELAEYGRPFPSAKERKAARDRAK